MLFTVNENDADAEMVPAAVGLSLSSNVVPVTFVLFVQFVTVSPIYYFHYRVFKVASREHSKEWIKVVLIRIPRATASHS